MPLASKAGCKRGVCYSVSSRPWQRERTEDSRFTGEPTLPTEMLLLVLNRDWEAGQCTGEKSGPWSQRDLHSNSCSANLAPLSWESRRFEPQFAYLSDGDQYYLLHSVQSVQSLSRVRLFATPRIAACQASLSITISRSLLRLTSIKLVMPSRWHVRHLFSLGHTMRHAGS